MKKEDKESGAERQIATIVDYQSTFNTPHGERVLRHLMHNHGMMITSYVEKDPYAMAFNEGGRNVIIHILKKLRIDVRKLKEEILKVDLQGESDAII